MPGRRPARHRHARAWPRRAGLALPLAAILVATGFLISRAGGRQVPAQAAGSLASAAPCPVGPASVTASRQDCQTPSAAGTGAPDGAARRRHRTAPATTRSPAGPGSRHTATPTPSRTPAPPSKAPHTPRSQGPPSGPPSGTGQDATAQVLAVINQARQQAGLAPYQVSPGLTASAMAHDVRMEDGCGLSHQCLNEYGLGQRESLAGVHWTRAGENIGAGRNPGGVAAAALELTQSMLDETAPSDGHRHNLLSRDFRFIGLAVLVDPSGMVWMTQDLAN